MGHNYCLSCADYCEETRDYCDNCEEGDWTPFLLFFYEQIGKIMNTNKYILRLSEDIQRIAMKSEIDLQDHNRLQEYTIELHSELKKLLKPSE